MWKTFRADAAVMDGYYAQNAQQQQQQDPRTMNMGATSMANPAGMGGEPLDEIVNDSQGNLMRRRSMPQGYGNDMQGHSGGRRMSAGVAGDIMAFGDANNGMRGYPFNQPVSGGFPTVNTNINMQNMGNYMDYSQMSPDLMGGMIPNQFGNMNMGIGTDPQQMNMFSPPGQYPPMGPSDFPMDMADNGSLSATPSNAPVGMGGSDERVKDMMPVGPQQTTMDPVPSTQAQSMNADPSMGGFAPVMPTLQHQTSSSTSFSPVKDPPSTSMTHPSSSSDPTTPATAPVAGPLPEKEKKTIYSKSGFDMLKALWLVATRKNPKIHLGAVDMSCAFVVCDVTMNDCPIIYVSDNFQNLTGYSRHDIVGQNCRFLQAPDGKVESGSKREFVDDGAVYNLKKMVHEGREVQQSLINYRKGGKPFLNLLTMIPIPWDTDEIRYFIGFQIDLVECPDAIASGQEFGGVKVNYKHSDIGQYIWTPPNAGQIESDNGQTLGIDDISTLLQQYSPKGVVSDWHKQSWDKMLLENTDDVVHVLSLKGLFLYLSPSCKRILEYDTAELVGNSLSTVCHPSDIVPVTRELKDTSQSNPVSIVYRIRRKNSGYTWFESHGSLFVEHGKGRKCIILVGRKRPVIALSRRSLDSFGGIGDSELWTKLSTSGMFLFVSSNIRSLLDLQPETLIGTSIQELMRKESRPEFGRAVEKARRGRVVTCKHEIQNRRGQVLQAQTVLYPGDANEGQKPSFLLAQTKLLKASSRSIAPAGSTKSGSVAGNSDPGQHGHVSQPAGGNLAPGTQDAVLASDDNMFDELRTTKCSSWQFELRQMEKINRILAEELGGLLSNKKKRKRRKGVGNIVRDCANCHTRNTPEWRRGPSGQRDLCNSCGLRWAKQVNIRRPPFMTAIILTQDQTGRVSPRNSSRGNNGDSQSKKSASPVHSSPLHKEMSSETPTHLAANAESGINPAQLHNAGPSPSAPSGAASAINSITMPPPSHSSMAGNKQAENSMTSIREERETSQPGG